MAKIIEFNDIRNNSDNRENSKVKNLKVNKKKKNTLKRGIALIIAGAIASGALVAVFARKQEKNLEDRAAIVSYYGEDSKEVDVLRYLDLSIKLDELDLDKFSVTQDLEYDLMIPQDLSRPTYIDLKIEEYKNIINDDNDLQNVYDTLKTIAFLKKQKELINVYISSNGYSTVYEDLRSSIKEYAAEEYNLDIPQNITFGYTVESGSGETIITMKYNEKYKEYLCMVNNNKIKKGVRSMVELQNINEQGSSNKQVLDEYIAALAKSIYYKNEVDEKDLYNKKSEDRLKGR